MDNFSAVLVLGFVSVCVLIIGVAVHISWKQLGNVLMVLGAAGLLVTTVLIFRGSMNDEPYERTPRPTRSSEFGMAVLPVTLQHSHY